MDIIEAQHELYGKLKIHDEIVGAENQGEYITILILNETILDRIPKEYEGFEVRTEITGPFFLQKD